MSRKLRIAFLDFGERWSRSIKVGITQNGHEVIEILGYKLNSFQELIDALDQIQPDFCLSRNFYLINSPQTNEQTYKDFFQNQKHRFVVWYHDTVEFNDPPFLLKLWQSPPYPQSTLFMSVEASDRSFFSQRGLPFVHLPIAAGEHFFHLRRSPSFEQLKTKFDLDITFVGSQIIELESPPDTHQNFASALGEGYAQSLYDFVETDHQALFTDEMVKFFNSDFRTPKEFRSGLSRLIQTIGEQVSTDTAGNLSIDRGRLNSFYSWMRLTNLLNDLRKFDIRVYGSELWRNSLCDYIHDTRSLSEDELVACYAGSKINLHFTKYHFSTGVHERPYNILAAHGFPLTDYREELEELFQEDEIATYGSQEELEDKINFFLKNDRLRREMIERGHLRVKADHTYKTRLEKLIDQACQFFGL